MKKLLCLLILLIFVTKIGFAGWIIEEVDNTDWKGQYNSIVLDSSDNPHISYYHGGAIDDLKYSYYDGNEWIIETVDSPGDVGRYSSIALDNDGNIHMSYYDSTEDDLKYAYRIGNEEGDCGTDNNWKCKPIDENGNVGWYTSLALDDNNRPHISYWDLTNDNLKYAYYDGNIWNIELVDSPGDVGRYSSIVIVNNIPHISYQRSDTGDLKYAYRVGTNNWDILIIDSPDTVGRYSSMVVDSKNNFHIGYFDETNRNLKYAHLVGTSGNCGGGKWNCETVDSLGFVGWELSINVDSKDIPHISYFDRDKDKLKYAYLDGDDWIREFIANQGDLDSQCSIALDSKDIVHISYHDVGSLMYARQPEKPIIYDVTPLNNSIKDKDVEEINITTNEYTDSCRIKSGSEDVWDNLQEMTSVEDNKYSFPDLSLGNGFYNYFIICRNSIDQETSYGLSFEIDKESLLITTDPRNETEDVLIDSIISIEFNKEMNEEDVEDNFEINPEVDGELEWDDNILIFTPDDDLEYNTNYTIYFEECKSIDENIIEDYEFWFKTEEESKDDECKKDSDCEDEQICEEKECIAAECIEDDECNEDEECKNNRCLEIEDDSCKKDWFCDDWGECEDELQTRECICECEDEDCSGDHDTERECEDLKGEAEEIIVGTQDLIDEANKLGISTSSIKNILTEAKVAFSVKDYKKAIELSEQAKDLAQEVIDNFEPSQDSPWIWVGIIIVVLLLIAAGIFVFLILKKKSMTSQNILKTINK